MSVYGNFAAVYDRLMADAEYDRRFARLKELFERYDRLPTLLLDLACGTGQLTRRFADAGTDVIGVDPSEQMLSVARGRCPSELLLCQRAEELDLYGTVDGAVCCLDSLNHITDYGDFCRAVARAALFLEKGRLFIFDLNTPHKHTDVLAGNTFVKEYDGLFCVWQNAAGAEFLNRAELDFFERTGSVWRRSHETVLERAYTSEQTESAVAAAGLETVAVFDDLSDQAPSAKTQRALYVTRRV